MRLLKVCFALLLAAFGTAVSAHPSQMGPPAELKKLEAYLGDWTYKAKWSMPGMEGEMAGTIKAEWDGQFMKMASVMEMSGMRMTETAYLGWDSIKGRYVVWTFTNYSPTPRFETATGDVKKLIFVSDPWEVMGQSFTTRTTISMKSDKEFVFAMEMKQGDAWTKACEGSQVKKG